MYDSQERTLLIAWIVERPNGYLVRWRDDRRRTVSKFCATPEEAASVKDAVEADARARRVLAGTAGIPGWDGDGPGVAPAEQAEYAVETYLRAIIDADRELRVSTREQYLTGLRVHIAGTPLGRADVRSVDGDVVRDFWASLDAGIGARRNVYLLLSKTFSRAIDDGLMDVSPLRRSGVRQPPKGRREEVVPLTVGDIERLADHASTTAARLAILVMAYGGLRAGEVAGLRVQDLDLERSRLTIRQQVARTRVEGKYVSPLKTRASRRTVTVPRSVADELRALISDDPPADDGRIFHGPAGELWAHSTINHAVKRAAKRAGIPGVFSHMLRHTAVSLLIEDGANPKAIQAFCGHSNIGTTLNVYGHLFDYGGTALGESMERRREAHRNGV